MKKLIFAFAVSASMFSAFSFTTTVNEEQPEVLRWVKIPAGTPCTTNDGQPGTLSGCELAPTGLRCSTQNPPAPECLPNG